MRDYFSYANRKVVHSSSSGTKEMNAVCGEQFCDGFENSFSEEQENDVIRDSRISVMLCKLQMPIGPSENPNFARLCLFLLYDSRVVRLQLALPNGGLTEGSLSVVAG